MLQTLLQSSLVPKLSSHISSDSVDSRVRNGKKVNRNNSKECYFSIYGDNKKVFMLSPGYTKVYPHGIMKKVEENVLLTFLTWGGGGGA